MKEHPLPQDITGYRFHIVGNMTLKQFALVAGGCVVGFFIYLTNLPAFISWPLILLSAGAGAFMAFIPFEERPFDHWVFTFFKVIYGPTQYYWERKPKLPPAFAFEPNQDTKQSMLLPELDLSPARRTRVKEYLRSVHQAPEQDTDEFYRADTLQNINDTFYGRPLSTVATPPPQPLVEAEGQATFAPLAQAVPVEEVVPVQLNVVDPTAAVAPEKELTPRPNFDPVQIPQTAPLDVPAPEIDSIPQTAQPTEPLPPVQQVYVTNTAPAPQDQAVSNVQFNAALSIPNIPTQPNKLVGVVTDGTLPIPYAIVEVLNQDGLTARAVKTNAFGQFFVSTALGNGTYLVQAEKEGLSFPTQQLELNGTIVPPIEITAQSQVQ